ncbi:MAG: peptidoglycan DD-metalloendopeptidase family protein [Candidatus Margulisbacteria bacterium]|nr:peptidoglycan DD-metalloendopeptidase family protein [Candidatus Margulisiibacteriota bacterium]
MRIFAAFLLLILIYSAADSAQDLSEEQKLEQINKELQTSIIKLEKTKKEEQAVLGRLVVITKELKRTQGNLYQAQKKINVNESEIGTLTAELSETKEDLTQREKKLSRRVNEVFKSSGVNYLQMLFTSGSMSDFFNRLYFFRQIINYDAELVQSVRADVRKAKQKRASLQTKTSEIRSLAKAISVKKDAIAEQAAEKNKIYKSLQQRRKEYEAHVAELEKSSKELEVLILKQMAARKGAKVRGSGAIAWPLRGRITSPFGYRRHPLWGGKHMHRGIDIAGKHGATVKAADSGEVIFSGWWDGYGKAIVIDHGRLTTTVYGHLSRIYKGVGAIVAKGQTIGLVGSTGYSTGPHLHFEVRKNGKPVNPMEFLN